MNCPTLVKQVMCLSPQILIDQNISLFIQYTAGELIHRLI
jgi:hypothetical protein